MSGRPSSQPLRATGGEGQPLVGCPSVSLRSSGDTGSLSYQRFRSVGCAVPGLSPDHRGTATWTSVPGRCRGHSCRHQADGSRRPSRNRGAGCPSPALRTRRLTPRLFRLQRFLFRLYPAPGSPAYRGSWWPCLWIHHLGGLPSPARNGFGFQDGTKPSSW